MSEKKGRISELFSRLDSERQDYLNFVRKCARLAGKPWILPDDEFEAGNAARRSRGEEDIPHCFQSLGQRGTSSLRGHFLMNGFPSDSPWFSYGLPGHWLYSDQIPNDGPFGKLEAQRKLFMAQLILTSLFESAPMDPETKGRSIRHSMGFRSALGRVYDYLLVGGDALVHLRDDFRLRTFRQDWYVTKRDNCGDVLCHVIKERKDPLEMSEEDRAECGIKEADLADKDAMERMEDLYTYVEWQPVTRKWVIGQEMCGAKFFEVEEDINPYISVPFVHTDGDDYGHGFIRLHYGDLSTFDRIEETCVEYAAMASKFHPCVGIGSNVRDRDLTAPSGTPIRDVMMGPDGRPKDIGFLTLDKLNDFQIVQAVREAKRKDLGAASLLESEAAPKGEAGRHSTAWRMTYEELARITGGYYPTIQEALQQGLIRRGTHVAQKNGLMPKFDIGKVEVSIMSGLNNMEKDRKRQRLIELAQVVQALGPETQARLDPEVFVDVYQRYSGFYEPGLMKSRERMKQETQAALAANAQQTAAEEGIKVLAESAKAGLIPQAA